MADNHAELGRKLREAARDAIVPIPARLSVEESITTACDSLLSRLKIEVTDEVVDAFNRSVQDGIETYTQCTQTHPLDDDKDREELTAAIDARIAAERAARGRNLTPEESKAKLTASIKSIKAIIDRDDCGSDGVKVRLSMEHAVHRLLSRLQFKRNDDVEEASGKSINDGMEKYRRLGPPQSGCE